MHQTNQLIVFFRWRGIRDEKLSEISGIAGGIFVHASGFIGGVCRVPYGPFVPYVRFNRQQNKARCPGACFQVITNVKFGEISQV